MCTRVSHHPRLREDVAQLHTPVLMGCGWGSSKCLRRETSFLKRTRCCGSCLSNTVASHQSRGLSVVEMFAGATVTETFNLHYPTVKDNENMLYGEAAFSYKRDLSERINSRTFSKSVTVSIDLKIWISLSNQGTGAFEFEGSLDADRVGGSLDCIMDAGNNDFYLVSLLVLVASAKNTSYDFWSSSRLTPKTGPSVAALHIIAIP